MGIGNCGTGHRVCVCESNLGNLALGGQGSRGKDHGNRTKRLPQPSQQFPGFPWRVSALDIKAQTITDDMAIAAAHELADYARERGIHENKIPPRWTNGRYICGLPSPPSYKPRNREQLHEEAAHMFTQARGATHLLIKERLIVPIPGTDYITLPFPIWKRA